MPGLDPQLSMHRLNIKPDAKLIKQLQQRFRSDIIETIKTEVHKLIECSFIREEQHPNWVANLYLCLRRTGRLEFALTSVISTQPVLRTNFRFRSLTSVTPWPTDT